MKMNLLAATLVLGTAQLALADLRIPGSVFKLDELNEAKAKAAKNTEPLIFVFTDPGTS